METQLFKWSERGIKKLDWLESNFMFSFSSYYNPSRCGFGLLKTFNDDFVLPGKGFGQHAHINMEIISIMLAGKMNHIDSMGYNEVVEKDNVQIMSAGSGLHHQEYNVGEERVNFLQIWIEPKLQNINPRYQKRIFPETKRENELVTVVSNEEGQAHCWINQNAKVCLGYYLKSQQLSYTFNPINKCVYIFVIDGPLKIAHNTVNNKDAIGVWNTGEVIINIEDKSKFVLIELPINH